MHSSLHSGEFSVAPSHVLNTTGCFTISLSKLGFSMDFFFPLILPKTQSKFQGEILLGPLTGAWAPHPKHLDWSSAAGNRNFIVSLLKTKILLLLSHIILSSGFQVLFCTQVHADPFGWMNALKVMGKTSNLEIIILKAEKKKIPEGLHDALIRNNEELFHLNTKNNSAIAWLVTDIVKVIRWTSAC